MKKIVYLIDNRELQYPFTHREAEALDDADFSRIAESMGNAWELEDFIIAYSQGSLPPYDCQHTRIVELTQIVRETKKMKREDVIETLTNSRVDTCMDDVQYLFDLLKHGGILGFANMDNMDLEEEYNHEFGEEIEIVE